MYLINRDHDATRISCDRSSSLPGIVYPRYTIGQHGRETNYHSINLIRTHSLAAIIHFLNPCSLRIHKLSRQPERSRGIKKKGIVEIISGRDRRLQGEGEETGSRLQRDRSRVSEMEPLPATQDALRLELRSARSLEVRHLLLPSSVPSLRGAAHGTTVDSRVPPSSPSSPSSLSTFPTFPSAHAARGSHKPPPTDFTPVT